MKMFKITAVVACLGLSTGSTAAQVDLDNLSWSVQYMIDQSQTVLGDSQFSGPRDTRGLAVDPTGQYLYAGYNNAGGGTDFQVRMIDLTQSDYTAATVANVTGRRGKAIAVDDLGRVYLAEGSSGIFVYDADLGAQQLNIATTQSEGIAVTRENETLVLYGTDRTDNTLTRWELTEDASNVTAATKAGLDGDGVIDIAGSGDLRGVAIDSVGGIWMADAAGGMVFRVDSDGTNPTSATVANPYAIAFNGDQALVTGGYSGTMISVLNADLTLDTTLASPLASLELDSDIGDGFGSSFTGIAVTDNRIYLSNEGGQTANARSTYGVVDDESGMLGETFYTDLNHDDNDPILLAVSSTAGIAGDYDDNGFVGQADLDLVLLNWGDTSPPAPTGWINEIPDGLIGQEALDGVLLNWGNGTPPITAVPEPSIVVLLVGLGLGIFARRGWCVV